MEQSKQSAQSAVNPNGKTNETEVINAKAKAEEAQEVKIVIGKKLAYALDKPANFHPLKFASFIGSLIDPENNSVTNSPLKKQAINFIVKDGSVNGLIVSIPAETVTSDRLTRVIKAVNDTTKQMFAGFLLEEETKNHLHRAILTSLNSVGIKFSTFTKIAVVKGLQTWANNKRSKMAILIEKNKVDNLRMIAENEVMRPEIKKLRIENNTRISFLLPEAKEKLSEFVSK